MSIIIADVNKISLFPITIFKTKVDNNDQLKKLLSSNIIQNSQHLNIPDNWFTNKLKTSFKNEPKGMELFNKDSHYLKILTEKYSICINKIFDKEFLIDITKVWYNVYTDGEYQEEHDHFNGPFNQTHFSCIHFLSFNSEEHYPPVFCDPISQLRSLSLEFESNDYRTKYIPEIEEGDLLMFPSYLNHFVLPCKKTNYPRITISFNIEVLKYGKYEK